MRLILILTLAFALCGCAMFGSSEESSQTVTPAAQEDAVKAAPDAKAELPASKSAKASSVKTSSAKASSAKASTSARGGKKSEAQIKDELDRMGHKLAAQSARTLLPNKANKEVRKQGNEYVATYLEVDANNVSTEMKPGANGQYVGFIRYQEHIFECRGATRQAALSAPCKEVRARRLNELIRYDGKAWQD